MPTPATTVLGSERRDAAVIDDITYVDAAGATVEAFLVHPNRALDTVPSAAPGPAVLAWHWFDTESTDSDRTQFLDEAVEMTAHGVTSLLPQGRFPWATPPTTAAADIAALESEVDRVHRGLSLLASRPEVDPRRLALVGHDFGGMLAAVAAPGAAGLRALVLVAAAPRWGDWFLPFWPIADDRIDYLRALRPLDPIERIGQVTGAEVLFQFGRRDFFIAPMTGLEFRGSAPEGTQLLAYDDDHAMRDPQIRADRLAFLRTRLGVG